MATLAQQRCDNHHDRGAAARCPECRSYFCHECVTEHEGRMICRLCLELHVAPSVNKPRRIGPLVVGLQCFVGLFVLWLFFYGVGRVLLAVPSDFHDAKVWSAGLEEFDD